MTAVLLNAKYVIAASSYVNLSRKAINSHQFSYVNMAYLYSREPGDSWRSNDLASCSVDH